MLPLLFAIIVFLFMVVGAAVFLICVVVPPFRRFALSAALWCVTWGPCSVALMTLAGLALVADAFITKNGSAQSLHSPKLLSVFGWGYLIAGALSTAAVATVAAWLHQFIVRRFTFALFRVYATLIVAGIGSVFAWALSWWMLSRDTSHVWAWSLLSMLVLVAGFGAAAYRGARGLRGGAPKNLAWVSQEEFTGS
jgi:hypothetical protein